MRKQWGKFIESKRWDGILIFVLTKLMAVGAAIPLTFAWREGNPYRTRLIILGVGIYLLAFVIDALAKVSERIRKSKAEQGAKEASSETTKSICHSISGIPQHTTSFLAQVMKGDSETRPHLDRYLADVMESLARMMTAREPRVCLYMADRAELPAGGSEGSVSLLLSGNAVGRSDPPRSVFDASSIHGKFVIQRMNERRPVIVKDTGNPPKDLIGVLDCSDKYYKSFVAVPVTYNDNEYGMLMIDSPEVNGLTDDQKVVAHLFGSFLGSGFHMVQLSPASLPRVSEASVSVTGRRGGEGYGVSA